MEEVLNFIFEALVLSPGTQDSWSPAVYSGRDAIALGLADKDKVDPDDDRLFGEVEFHDAYRSWSVFHRTWYDDGFDAPVRFPHASSFASLRRLSVNLTSGDTLSLILNTSSFPSLSHLKVASPANIAVHVPLNAVKTMRFAITNSIPDSSHGKLLSPLVWLQEQHRRFSLLFNLDVAPFEPWPPLSPVEQQSYHDLPYRGPRLAVLDIRSLNLRLQV
ncbi:hypothetical protein JCM10207_005472 [Rhodosporidiobolus poonsookiae]